MLDTSLILLTRKDWEEVRTLLLEHHRELGRLKERIAKMEEGK